MAAGIIKKIIHSLYKCFNVPKPKGWFNELDLST